jgi:anti-sigma factor RsiW
VNHSRAQELLSPYLESDLSGADRSAVESHLAACAACSEELDLLRDTVALLRRLPAPEAPPFLASRVLARIADGEAQPGGWRSWLAQASAPVIAAPFAAAAAALLVFAFATPSGEDAGPVQVAGTRSPAGPLVTQFTGPVALTAERVPAPGARAVPRWPTRGVLPDLLARQLRGAGHPASAELAGHFDGPSEAVAVSWRTR